MFPCDNGDGTADENGAVAGILLQDRGERTVLVTAARENESPAEPDQDFPEIRGERGNDLTSPGPPVRNQTGRE